MAKKLHVPSVNPLTDLHHQTLNQVLEGVQAGRQLCARASAAGLNMQPFAERLDAIEGLAQGIKAQFFPHKS